MAKILELSETLANQIAAGEVVERPASVVKELLENAIDAGSTQIDVEIEEAGLKKIVVRDNGAGIAADDVENAFKRHATSKIHGKEDLFRIRTLGFRGEALPSIASVAQVTMESATQEAVMGTTLKIVGGKITEKSAAPVKVGTTITVENLFFNTPARLKYVKSLQTELANIGDIVNRLALSHPNIAMRLTHDGNPMTKTVGNGDLKQAIAGIYGMATAKKMVAIEASDLDFKIAGFVSLPEVTRASRNYLSIIINGRYIRNFLLNKAIINGYRSKLMVGRFPIAVITIETDPLLVDVNVHPTKQEVRLSKEKELMGLIEEAIFTSLQKEQLIPEALNQLSFKRKNTEPIQTQDLPLNFHTENVDNSNKKVENFSTYPHTVKTFPHNKETLHFDEKTGDFFVSESLNNKNVDNSVDNVDKSVDNYENETKVMHNLSTDFGDNSANDREHPAFDLKNPQDFKSFQQAQKIVEQDALAHEKRFPQLDYFGQMHGTFLFAQNETGLYIVDQHAAQERIKYEYYREEIGKVSGDLQELLLPIVLEYPVNDYLAIQEKMSLLNEIGIFLEEFGQGSFLLRTHPTWIAKGDEEKTVRELIEMLLLEGSVSIAKYRAATAIMMSCKRSIKANHYLNEPQARQLLNDLALCENPFNCPHGRPVLIQFSNTDLEKMFKRIQDPH
ncbi:DNA mismatch repair endonuclease MutL [Enterococcus timonensis]|uniref:DNA mismatch repair endonuclease MutL n=1 Tax=Enterococcus timonensis TaxID=1852364 RepID=UPI0008D97B4C|nr:DNA mismatch repair endonuclease MutL [Enterococcus timonensis]